MIDLTKSKAAFEEARKFMPGGVNSPVRSYPHMGCPPPFIASAKGSHITDIDGNTYIDYVGSWGPMVPDTHIQLSLLPFRKQLSEAPLTVRRHRWRQKSLS